MRTTVLYNHPIHSDLDNQSNMTGVTSGTRTAYLS